VLASKPIGSSSFVAVWCLRDRDAQPFNQPDMPRQAGSCRLSQTLSGCHLGFTLAHASPRWIPHRAARALRLLPAARLA